MFFKHVLNYLFFPPLVQYLPSPRTIYRNLHDVRATKVGVPFKEHVAEVMLGNAGDHPHPPLYQHNRSTVDVLRLGEGAQ
jgi:hypothetical protein